MFREALVTVWGPEAVRVSFDVRVVALEVLATMSYDSNAARAEGRTLLRYASHHLVNVSERLLLLNADVVRRVLLHEAIHVGYRDHDAGFEEVAAEVGTASTERQILGLGFEVQRETPRGFEMVLETMDREEAFRFARERKAGPGLYKVIY